MKRHIGIRSRTQRGNAMIEFALSATVLFMVAFGTAGLGRLVTLAVVAQGAAEAGVQYGAIGPANYGNMTGMQNAALSDTGNYASATAAASQFCTCSVGGTQQDCPASCENGNGQTYVQVSVTLPFQTFVNFPWVPNPVNVTQTAVARVQ